jgi:hypothetical protein
VGYTAVVTGQMRVTMIQLTSFRLWRFPSEQIAVVAVQAQQVIAKPEISYVQLVAASFGVAATSGLAKLLYSRDELTRRRLLASVLHSGMWGVTVALLWATFVSDDPLWIIGTASLAGFGVVSLPKLTGTRFTVGGMTIEMKNSGDDWDAQQDGDRSPRRPYDSKRDHDDRKGTGDRSVW